MINYSHTKNLPLIRPPPPATWIIRLTIHLLPDVEFPIHLPKNKAYTNTPSELSVQLPKNGALTHLPPELSIYSPKTGAYVNISAELLKKRTYTKMPP